MTKKYYPIIIVFFVLFVDQSLKIWTKTNFRLGENIFDVGVLRFDFVENPGMAFGLSFGGLLSKYFLGVFRLLAVFFIAKYILQLIHSGAHRGLITLASFIFAGAVGNILDNLSYGLLFDSGTSRNNEIDY